MIAARREYIGVLLLGAAGAGLVLLAGREPWAHVVTRASAPLPASSVAVSGQDLVPLAAALAVAALAGVIAVIATRRTARRVVGLLLAVLGAGIAAAVSVRLDAASVLAAAHSAGAVPAGSGTTGSSGAASGMFPGGMPGVSAAGRVVAASIPWRALAVAGSAAVLAAGVLTAWRGSRWPGLSSLYEPQPGGRERPAAGADSATLWESLSRGVDPTESDAVLVHNGDRTRNEPRRRGITGEPG